MVEVHQAMGTDFKTLAVGRLSWRDLFEKPSGRLHSSAQLTATGAFRTPATATDTDTATGTLLSTATLPLLISLHAR